MSSEISQVEAENMAEVEVTGSDVTETVNESIHQLGSQIKELGSKLKARQSSAVITTAYSRSVEERRTRGRQQMYRHTSATPSVTGGRQLVNKVGVACLSGISDLRQIRDLFRSVWQRCSKV